MTMTLYELIVQAYTTPPDPNDPFSGGYHPPTGTYTEIADFLNAPTVVDNPVTEPPQIPAPITLKALMSVVPPAEMVAVYQTLPAFVADLKKAIDDQDREYMAGLLTIAATAQVISQATTTQLQAMLTATIPDPDWTPTVLGPSQAAAAGLDEVKPEQVQLAMGYWPTGPWK